MKKCVVTWRNRRSGETGYVKSIKVKEGHFESTSIEKDAQKYANAGLASSAVTTLYNLPDAEENEYAYATVGG